MYQPPLSKAITMKIITLVFLSLTLMVSGFCQSVPSSIAFVSKYPALTVVDDTTRQLNAKYESYVKIMSQKTAFSVAQLMRKSLPADIKYWAEEAARPLVSPPAPTLQEMKQPDCMKNRQARIDASKKKKDQANANLKWLSETLPAWITEVEKIGSQ